MNWEMLGVHLLELLKCSIGIIVAIFFYKTVIALETIAGTYEGARRIKLNSSVTLNGKAILFLTIFTVLFFIGMVVYGVYQKKYSNYQEIWKWKGSIENRVNLLEKR